MKRTIVLPLLILLGIGILVAGCSAPGGGGGSDGSDESSSSSTTSSSIDTSQPIRIGINLDLTGALAAEAARADHGIKTALQQIGYKLSGRQIEIFPVDNGSDLVTAVEKTKKLVQQDDVDVVLGPLAPASNAAVTDYLANFLGKKNGVPCISILGQPAHNLGVANGVAIVPEGVHSAQGYYLGKYARQLMLANTANVISGKDPVSIELMAGFNKAFIEEGKAKTVSEQDVDAGPQDYSAKFAALKKTDIVVCAVPADQAASLLRQYAASGLTAPLLLLTGDDLPGSVLAGLSSSVRVLVAQHYLASAVNELNTKFVQDYTAQWEGEQPDAESFGGWLAVNVFLKAVEAAKGDTTPKALIAAASTLTLDTPGGIFTMMPYEKAVISKGNLYVATPGFVGGRLDWREEYMFEQVSLEPKE